MSKGRKNKYIRSIILTIYLFATGITGLLCAQDTTLLKAYPDTIIPTSNSIHITDEVANLTETDMHINNSDTVIAMSDSVLFIMNDSVFIDLLDSIPPAVFFSEDKKHIAVKKTSEFKPNPNVAWKAAIIFPGFGQIYNQQYWKLPIVYGGLMGCIYAITWNNKTYQDYKMAYFDISIDAKNDPKAENPDSWSENWKNFVRGSDYASYLHNRNFHDNLKRGKDYFRRYRDLSIILCAGIYMIFVADSYVDAQMFDFDVSPDLSFQVTPVFTPETINSSRSFGINVCMTF
jgi:hypothetical protein